MYERLIFDIDGTLISDVDFSIYSKKALTNIGYNADVENLKLIQNAIHEYEIKAKNYDRSLIAEYFNEYLGSNVGRKFIDEFLIQLEDAIPVNFDKEVIDTLEYLKDKYQMSILTNWFQISQERRLIKLGLKDYFDKLVYGDIVKKPNRESYIVACANTSREKCLMIGDSYPIDYKGAVDAGLNAILIDKDDKYRDIVPDKLRIRKLADLKNIL